MLPSSSIHAFVLLYLSVCIGRVDHDKIRREQRSGFLLKVTASHALSPLIRCQFRRGAVELIVALVLLLDASEAVRQSFLEVGLVRVHAESMHFGEVVLNEGVVFDTALDGVPKNHDDRVQIHQAEDRKSEDATYLVLDDPSAVVVRHNLEG